MKIAIQPDGGILIDEQVLITEAMEPGRVLKTGRWTVAGWGEVTLIERPGLRLGFRRRNGVSELWTIEK